MDLWIRTQKKTNLIKVKHVFIDDKRCILPEEDEGIKIVAPYDDETAVILGRYKTEERALEVLDEIQKILIGRLIIKTNRKVGSEDLNRLANFFDTKHVINDNEFEFIQPEATNIIYEMPKE